jgi:dTDP-4-amino-4,6-dideoxygalactose transaminase
MILQSSPKASYEAHRHAIDAAIARTLASGWYVLGEEGRRFEEAFAEVMQANWCLGLASGTDAVELALRACGVTSGDRVLTVSHTAVATVSAISRIGALPVFVDIDPCRYTMAPDHLESVLATPSGMQAKALVVVHLYGQPADMDTLLPMARERGLAVIEDCAQAHAASFRGRFVGTLGDIGCFSFYPTKNLGALGDGGAVIGNDERLADRVRLLREYGWQTRYVSEVFGVNSRLDELQAAVLLAKLPFLERDNARRREIASWYDAALAGCPVQLPPRASDSQPVFHQYVVATDRREPLRESLQNAGVGTLIHYPRAVHQQPAYADPIFCPLPLPQTENVTERILSLPMYPELTDAEVVRVGELVSRFTQV